MKTSPLFCSAFAALVMTGVTAPFALNAASCCHPEIAATTPLPAASLYQAEVGFTTDDGKPFNLVELRGRPVAITMFFSTCTYACPATTADLAHIRGRLPADVRDRALIVMVSFDTARDTPATLKEFRETRVLDKNWILLRGNDDAVRELAALLGVKFKREADGQFAHSNLITILSPEGEIVHQRAGLTGGLDEATVAFTAVAVKRDAP
jgi:protein SCO1/2